MLTADPARAVEALLAGGLVALPTETVYGLGADAEQPHAVARVFAVKGRPADHPLIVHVRGAEDLDAWARDIPPYARALAEALWPGPLTLVLPRSARAGDHVTGGQDTVGLRAPSHPVAREVLAALGGRGIAAPSANRFGRVSPTTAQHVLDELGALLDPATDLVLDGGACDVGVESTILDCTGERPRLLRPGAVDADTVAIAGGVPLDPEGVSSVRAPGTLASHYAPSARVTVADEDGLAEALAAAAARRPRTGGAARGRRPSRPRSGSSGSPSPPTTARTPRCSTRRCARPTPSASPPWSPSRRRKARSPRPSPTASAAPPTAPDQDPGLRWQER